MDLEDLAGTLDQSATDVVAFYLFSGEMLPGNDPLLPDIGEALPTDPATQRRLEKALEDGFRDHWTTNRPPSPDWELIQCALRTVDWTEVLRKCLIAKQKHASES